MSDSHEPILIIIRYQLGIEHDGLPLTDDMHLYNDLSADSLDIVELNNEIEAVLGIVVPYSIARQWQTVGDVLVSVEQAEVAA